MTFVNKIGHVIVMYSNFCQQTADFCKNKFVYIWSCDQVCLKNLGRQRHMAFLIELCLLHSEESEATKGVSRALLLRSELKSFKKIIEKYMYVVCA